MARTWPVTRRKRSLLAAFDAVAGPVASVVLRKKRAAVTEISRILVLEIWHMGDVVIATSALQRLRAMYPSARITLLAKPHAIDLLEGSDLVDEIATFDFPWTSTTRKYSPQRYDVSAMKALVRKLRGERFDLSVDCRMDLRSNILTYSVGAARRVGYDFGGGSFLLTDAVPPGAPDRHKVDDWMALIDVLDDSRPVAIDAPDPKLFVSEMEREEARRVLESYGVVEGDILVGLHPGGSHEAKRWSEDNFAEVGKSLVGRDGVKVLVFIDPDGCGSEMQIGRQALFVRTSIREMVSLIGSCDLLLCNDSGPMHIAAALGVPVTAIFRTGSPSAYGPRGSAHSVIGNGAEHALSSDVSVDDVMDAVDAQVARIRTTRSWPSGSTH